MPLGYARKKIRENLVTALSGITTVGGRVVSGDPEPGIGLPNITYTIESEELSPEFSSFVSGDDPSGRALRITVEGRAETEDGSQSPIDDLCLEIEKEIASAATLCAWCKDLRLDSTAYEHEDANRPISVATLEYVGYYDDPLEITATLVESAATSSSIAYTATTPVYAELSSSTWVNGVYTPPTSITTSGTTHFVELTGLTAGSTVIPFYFLDNVPPTYMDFVGLTLLYGPLTIPS